MWNGFVSCNGYLNISLTAVRPQKSLQCIFIIFTHIISFMETALQHLSMGKDEIVLQLICTHLEGVKISCYECFFITENRQPQSPLKCFQEVYVASNNMPVCDLTIKLSPDMLTTLTDIVNI